MALSSIASASRRFSRTFSSSSALSRRASEISSPPNFAFYAWKAKFGGMDVSDAKRLKALEEENAKLKRLYADAMLDNAGLKELLAKKW